MEMSIIHNDLTTNNIGNSYYKKYISNLPYTLYLTTNSIFQQIVLFKNIFSLVNSLRQHVYITFYKKLNWQT